MRKSWFHCCAIFARMIFSRSLFATFIRSVSDSSTHIRRTIRSSFECRRSRAARACVTTFFAGSARAFNSRIKALDLGCSWYSPAIEALLICVFDPFDRVRGSRPNEEKDHFVSDGRHGHRLIRLQQLRGGSNNTACRLLLFSSHSGASQTGVTRLRSPLITLALIRWPQTDPSEAPLAEPGQHSRRPRSRASG